MLLSRLGLVELTQPDITLSGLNPFELRQSREAQISKHIHARTHICACTHPHERIKREALHATEYAPVHCPPDTHTRAYVFIDIYLYLSNLCCFDTCQEKTEFVMLPGSSSYTISSECVQLKGKRVNFLNFSILF